MALRLKGQEVNIKIVQGSQVVTEIVAIGSMNDNVDLESKKDDFLGRKTSDYDELLNGFGGDMEIQVATASWVDFQKAVIARATREQPDLVFNVVRTDLFADGTSNIYTYTDVKFGAQPTSIASRGDFVKVKIPWNCSERPVQTNAIL